MKKIFMFVLNVFIIILFYSTLNAGSILITNCDTITNWSSSPTVITTLSVDPQIKNEGAGSIRFNVSEGIGVGNWAEINYRPAVTNWLIGQTISFWMYLDLNASKIDVMELYVYDTNNNWYKWTFYYKLPAETWHYYTFWLNSPSESSAAEINFNIIRNILLRIKQSASSSPEFNVYIDDIRLYHGFTWNLISKMEASCTEAEAKEEVAAKVFVQQEPAPWVDIVRHITPADKARGFIEIGVSFYGSGNPRWIFYGDDDTGGNRDLRAFCDGITYELRDTRYKAPPGARDAVFPLGKTIDGARAGSWLVLEFFTPRKIYDHYKIFLGIGNLSPALRDAGFRVGDTWVPRRPYWMETYYRAEVYFISPLPGIYADFIIKDVAEEAKWEYDKVNKRFNYVSGIYSVSRNIDLEFDATPTVNYKTNATPIAYHWDFGDGTSGSGIKIKHRFATAGSKKVSLTIIGSDGKTYPENPYARKTLTVNVIERPARPELFQNGPNPFDLSVQNPVTKIKYKLSEKTTVRMRLYSLTGKLIKVLIDNKEMEPGIWEVEWDGKDEKGNFVDTGVYIYSLKAGPRPLYRTMLVIR